MNFIVEDNYIALVRCYTYNHAGFIIESLDGFAAQETNFPFVCVVVDDCSTDGTTSDICEWMYVNCEPNGLLKYDLDLAVLYVARHKSNQESTFAFYLLKRNLYKENSKKEQLIEPWRNHSKYEALCEGDDYWNDSKKLQEQVDFLEKYNNYSGVSSNASVLRSLGVPMRLFGSKKTRDYSRLREIIPKRKFHTASVVYRISSMQGCPFRNKGDWDTFLWCCLLTQGPIHYEGKVTCVYRKQQQGITESTPKIEWLVLTSKWADIINECFVPQFVKRKYTVRPVTRDIIRVFINSNRLINKEEKNKLIALYFHNFSIWNTYYDLKEVIIQSIKKLIR